MVRTILVAFAAALTFGLAAPASADWYVKAEVGTTVDTQISDIEFSDEITYGAYVGTNVGPFRVEAGASHLAGDLNLGGISVDASAIDYNATAYLDTASGFYVGAGVDYVTAEASIGPWFSTDAEGFGYHVTAGYATRINDRSIFEVQARYLEADLDAADLQTIAVTAGVRFGL